jgi:hypothetical protein
VPEMNLQQPPSNFNEFLGAPDQGQKHKKPRDSFMVMRMRSQKHSTLGITIPEKNQSFWAKILSIMCCKGDDAAKVENRPSTTKISNKDFDNLRKSYDESDKLPTPNRLKNGKEESKSNESSSEFSSFPAVHMNNKDALKNILNREPKKKAKGLKREPKPTNSALGVPEEKIA